MDFSFTEEQLAVASLATQLFTAESTIDRIREVERTEDRFDRHLWDAVVAAGIPLLAVPEEAGGSGLGITELCLALEQQGRRVAHVPLLWHAVALMTVAPSGLLSPEAVDLWTIGLSTAGTGDPFLPGIVASGDVVNGRVPCVPWGHVATRAVIGCLIDGEPALVAISLADARSSERAVTTDRSIVTHLDLVDTPATVIGRGRSVVRWAYERVLCGLAALQLGVASEALAQAAAYTSGRLQFGKPLSSFQSTSARAADAYIDTEAMRATLWQAAWRLDAGLDATKEVEVAKWWAAEGGQRVVHAAQHLHGGIGADVEYPIHRYFLWGKQLEVTLGGGSAHLARLADAL